MIQTSKEMLKDVNDRIDRSRKDLTIQKDELKNLDNQLKVEERILIELRENKDKLVEDQKYIVIAVQSEIEMQKNRIYELEVDLKLLSKKYEVLNRDWNF